MGSADLPILSSRSTLFYQKSLVLDSSNKTQCFCYFLLQRAAHGSEWNWTRPLGRMMELSKELCTSRASPSTEFSCELTSWFWTREDAPWERTKPRSSRVSPRKKIIKKYLASLLGKSGTDFELWAGFICSRGGAKGKVRGNSKWAQMIVPQMFASKGRRSQSLSNSGCEQRDKCTEKISKLLKKKMKEERKNEKFHTMFLVLGVYILFFSQVFLRRKEKLSHKFSFLLVLVHILLMEFLFLQSCLLTFICQILLINFSYLWKLITSNWWI